MKRLIWIFIASISIISCDFGEFVWIVNNTDDTIIIGSANCNNIDSIKEFLHCDGAIFDGTKTEKDDKGNLIISNWNLVYPDSAGRYEAFNMPLFALNFHQKGYFFIIKQSDARNYTWNEIVDKKLYDLLIVTQEMVKDSRTIKYSPQKRSMERQGTIL